MAQKKTIVISDIHMGINNSTNWYNKEIHEPYFAHILEWILNNSDQVDELIILGDLFDFWTYAPDEKPHSSGDIIEANPTILGPDGMMSHVLDALDGRVSYVHGNHDITTTQQDLDGIGSSQHKIRLQRDIYIKGDVIYTHGHLFTLFNAPDISTNPPQPIPAGHFVTRAISYMLKNKGEEAYEEPGFGAEDMGYDGLGELLSEGPEGLKDKSVSDFLLNHIEEKTGIHDGTEIILERDLGSMTFGEAKERYANLFSSWVSRYSKGEDGLLRGLIFAYKATWADKDGSYLGWFAQKIALEMGANLVVMGHTHIPKKGLKGGIVNYINSGFECVPGPDMGSDKMTYSVVTTEDDKYVDAQVFAVVSDGNGGYKSENDAPPQAEIFGEEADDFSCYITVTNSSNEDFELVSAENNHGYFVAYPPSEIRQNSTVKFWIQDFPGLTGSEGKVTYKGKSSGKEVPLIFRCTTVDSINDSNANLCSGTNEFYSKSGSASGEWKGKNIVEQSGHPFFVKFVLQNNNGNEFTKDGNSLVAANGTSLKLGEYLTVNGSTDLSNVLTDKDDSKVYSIKLDKSSSPAFAYVVTIDGQGPDAGWNPTKAGETLVLKFYNEEGEIDFETLYSSKRKEHVMRYSSDAPYITKVTWEVRGDI